MVVGGHTPAVRAGQTQVPRLATTFVQLQQSRGYAGIQQPNKFTAYITQMKTTCPEVMEAYATCVSTANEDGLLTKGVCAQEFRAVKECFRSAQKELREKK